MKNNTKKTLKLYWHEAKKHKITGLILLFSSILTAVVEAFIPFYFKNFFDILSESSGIPTSMVVESLFGTLLFIAFLFSLSWALWRVNTFTLSYFEAKMLAQLANKCFAYLHHNSFSFFNNNFVGSLVKKVNWFTRAFEDIIDQAVFSVLPLVVGTVMVFIILGRVNIWLGFAMLGWVVIFTSISWIFTKFKLKYDIERNKAESTVTGRLADTITNNSNVKLFNGYGREVGAFEKDTAALAKIRKYTWDLSTIFEAVQGFLSISIELGIFYFAIKLWQKNILTIGDFVLIQTYILTMMNKVWSFSHVLRHFYEKLSDAEEMTIVFDTPHEIQDIPRAKDLKVLTGEVVFQNVNFNYNQTRSVLKKFNLSIPAKQRLAIIGPSGAGKTTIIKLLFRMHDVASGKIFIDNQNIAKVTQESLWKNVALVPQDPILFHRTLFENIQYGNPEASKDEVIKASKAAHCHDFIKSLDDGYDTYVGERGVKLSGGERQRVAIARAILKNAPILVLDEATSSLDSESELLIQEALAELMKNKTVVVIAHRLSTIRKMDRIIVVDEGGIVEDGAHNALLKKIGGIYNKLWKLQVKGFIK
ncbi:MAG TPA: ABC transporter ATP-binding protein [Patescibacteria group bacterium]|nr:ABC transporter ATP-binding protein [Patescibacteria group bacterium]